MTKTKSKRDMRALSADEIGSVAGGAIGFAKTIGVGVVMRPDGGTCTDPWPLPTKGPFIPRWPFPGLS
jgi:hypothetical protein